MSKPEQLQSVRGTHDLLPEVQRQHVYVGDLASEICETFGFEEMSTPIFEFTNVFKRTLGEASDIVHKEMYTFADRNGDEMTLRPEGTAGIARSFISEGLSQRTPFKIFYRGPMFRYERPQKGRQRQFHQLGVELLGASSPWADIEVLSLAHQILLKLGIRNDTTLELNSIGDSESRKAFLVSLTQFLEGHRASLSEDSQRRLNTNPLRILDSKDPKDQQIVSVGPKLADFYTPAALEIFNHVQLGLKELGIPFVINPRLVRGLDYYSHCVFEFKTTKLGAQDAVLSGGRYDQLVETMGGPATPSVGWAAGIERLVMLAQIPEQARRPVAVVPVHNSVETAAFKICNDLRAAGIKSDISFTGNMSKRMKRAAQSGARACVILGPDEVAKGQAQIKWMDSGEQQNCVLSELVGLFVSR